MEINEIYFERISSTNQWAKEHLHELNPAKLNVIIAEEQTRGYGQRGRSWLAPKGALTLSFCLNLGPGHEKDPFLFTRFLAESLIILLDQYNIKAQIKWPNDIQVNQKKIAGILCEATPAWIIMGVGMNVNLDTSFLQQIDQPTTSLFMETQNQYSIKKLIKNLQEIFLKIIDI